MKNKKQFKIEVSKVCKATSKNGTEVNITEPMLQEIAQTYDPAVKKAPFVFGHPKHDDPAMGWAAKMEYDQKTQKLYALGDPDQISPELKDKVDKGDYKHISMSMYPPGASNNPTPGKWYAKHNGLLGGTAPAVHLKEVSFDNVMNFSEDDEALEFSYEMEPVKSNTDNIKAWMVDKFTKMLSSEVIPNFNIKDIEDDEKVKTKKKSSKQESDPSPAFSENDGEVTMTEEEIKAMQAENKALKKSETALASTVSKFQDEAAAKRATSVKEFCDGLVASKKLMPDHAKKLNEVLTAVGAPNAEAFEFSEGGEKTTIQNALMDVIKGASEYSFNFSEKSNEPDGDEDHSFSTPPGTTVDPAAVKKHNKALQIAKEKGIDYIDAINLMENAS
tara:strand:+ start:3654 stop:4820 length:1167 start_codon:yes stop_codon:yes gene_type:complete